MLVHPELVWYVVPRKDCYLFEFRFQNDHVLFFDISSPGVQVVQAQQVLEEFVEKCVFNKFQLSPYRYTLLLSFTFFFTNNVPLLPMIRIKSVSAQICNERKCIYFNFSINIYLQRGEQGERGLIGLTGAQGLKGEKG